MKEVMKFIMSVKVTLHQLQFIISTNYEKSFEIYHVCKAFFTNGYSARLWLVYNKNDINDNHMWKWCYINHNISLQQIMKEAKKYITSIKVMLC